MKITKSHLRKIIREAIHEERERDWNYKLTQIVNEIGPEQALLDFVGAVFLKRDLAAKMLSAILHTLPEDAIVDGVDYLERVFRKGENRVEERKQTSPQSNEQLNTLVAKQDPYELIANAVDAVSLGGGIAGKSFVAFFYALPEEFLTKRTAHSLLYAILEDLEASEMEDLIDDLYSTYTTEGVAEALSKKEKKKRKTRRVFGKAPEDDTGVPDEIVALGRGIVGNRNDDEELEENECAGNPFRNSRGRYSSHREPGSYTLPKKPKKCRTKSGQGRRAAGSRDNDKSEAPCGRKKKADGSQTKCRDGSPRG